MKKNWPLVILYIAFIGFAASLVATYTEAERVITFLRDVEYEVQDDPYKLLNATVVANNRLDKKFAIIQIEPLFEEVYTAEDHALKVSIFTLIEYHPNQTNNALAILIDDLRIDDENLFKDEDQYSAIEADIIFNEPVKIGATEKVTFTESFITLYNDESKLMLMNYDRLETDEVIFKYIQFKYKRFDDLRENLLILNNEEVSTQQGDKFSETYNRNIETLSKENIDLISKGVLDNYQNNNAYYADDSYIAKLDSYYYIYIKNMGIFIGLVAIATYFIFFHKYVYESYKLRKETKRKEHLEKVSEAKTKMKKDDKESL